MSLGNPVSRPYVKQKGVIIMKDYSNRNLTRQYQLRDKAKFVENKPTTTKEKNKLAKEITKGYEIEEELQRTMDLYQDAKRSGDNNLAMEILDQRLKLEAKKEVERAWIRTKSPEDVTVEILEKLKDRGDI
jgi:hypothetical protein